MRYSVRKPTPDERQRFDHTVREFCMELEQLGAVLGAEWAYTTATPVEVYRVVDVLHPSDHMRWDQLPSARPFVTERGRHAAAMDFEDLGLAESVLVDDVFRLSNFGAGFLHGAAEAFLQMDVV